MNKNSPIIYWPEREALIQSRLKEMGYLFEIKEIEGERRAIMISSQGKEQKPVPDNACYKLDPYEYMSALLRGMTASLTYDALYELGCLTKNDLKALSTHSALRVERALARLEDVEVNNCILLGQDPRKTNKEES